MDDQRTDRKGSGLAGKLLLVSIGIIAFGMVYPALAALILLQGLVALAFWRFLPKTDREDEK
jgi:hypothetical protein